MIIETKSYKIEMHLSDLYSELMNNIDGLLIDKYKKLLNISLDELQKKEFELLKDFMKQNYSNKL